jgi:flagellar FliL protein
MATNRLEQPKPAEETPKPAEQKQFAPPPVKSGGGNWVPLIANIVLMPVIAWALTTYVLIPRIQSGQGNGVVPEASSSSSASAKGAAKGKITVPLNGRVLVNVGGTAGTRYIVAAISLVGKKLDLKQQIEENNAQLLDAAASILGAKTISDLEKPGLRNIVRAELIAAFNDILGKETINDIYLTEFAIQ